CPGQPSRLIAARPVTTNLSEMTHRLAWLADCIDRLTGTIGRTVAWCTLIVVLTQFAVVLMRYLLGMGSIWLSESIIYGHAAVFLLKTLIPLFALSMALQGVSQAIRAIEVLRAAAGRAVPE